MAAKLQLSSQESVPPSTTALEELLSSLLEAVILASAASEGSLMLLHQGRELLTVNAARGPHQDVVRTARRHLGEGISGWVAQSREPLLLVGPIHDPRFPASSPQVKDAMCVPLLVEEQVVGVLSLSNKRGDNTFSQQDLEQLVDLSRPVARVVEVALAQREADTESNAWARKQLAREIHDGLLQSMNSLLLHLRLYQEFRERDPAQAEEELERSQAQAEEALQELRHLVFDLRLPEGAGLSLAEELKGYLIDFEKRSQIQVHLAVSGQEPRLPVNVKKNLSRIVQEALTNIRRHAVVKEADVRLDFRPQELVLEVRDRGKGFDPTEIGEPVKENKFGLLGMQERVYLLGGNLHIATSPGQGTTVSVSVPL